MAKRTRITGRNPVKEHLAAGKNLQQAVLHISEKAHGKIIADLRSLARSKGVAVVTEPREFFLNMKTNGNPQGVMLEIEKSAEESSITSEWFISTLRHEKGYAVILDQITDPHNLGAIIRSAEALGALGVVVPTHHSAELNDAAHKASAGATAHLPILQVPNLARFMDEAKKEGVWIAGSSDHGTSNIEEVREIRPLLLVIGSEGEGMRRLTEEKCDYILRIPLKGTTSSLNASVAAGILLHALSSAQN